MRRPGGPGALASDAHTRSPPALSDYQGLDERRSVVDFGRVATGISSRSLSAERRALIRTRLTAVRAPVIAIPLKLIFVLPSRLGLKEATTTRVMSLGYQPIIKRLM